MGLQTGATLGLRDVFYLGRFAYMQNKPYVALHWLKEAIAQAPFDDSKILDQNQVNAIHDSFDKSKCYQIKFTSNQTSIIVLVITLGSSGY